MIEVRNYVDGKWVTPPCERFSSRNPFTAEVLSTAPESDERAVDAAVGAARAAFDGGGWRWQKGSERAAALHAFADTLEQHASPIAKLIAREMGKPITVALTREVEGAIDKLRYYAGMARNLDGRVLGGTLPEIWDMELPEPIGVCALIVPWNDPVDLAVRKMGAALAAGCSMVVKSSEVTPASTEALISCAHESGAFPAGVVNYVNGGAATGEALVSHPGVNKIGFTGSTETGIRIMELAAKGLKKISLECGGKLPAIVFPDADLEKALDAVTYGAFMYSGQSCTACTRLIVHEALRDRVIEGLIDRSQALMPGDPLDPEVLVGPMASAKQYHKALSYIRIGLAEGGKTVLGGVPLKQDGLKLNPTVIIEAPPDGRLARQEVFGPVLSIFTFIEDQEALRIANDTPYGLGGSIWSRDINRALRTARQLDIADIWINTHYIRHAEASFGGRHLSGVGRELGKSGVEEYLSWKRLCIDTRPQFHLKELFAATRGNA
jgi:acyl-CoA reductase-like NAD-dependent aldehyde dehydrogenase